MLSERLYESWAPYINQEGELGLPGQQVISGSFQVYVMAPLCLEKRSFGQNHIRKITGLALVGQIRWYT